ncbi:MAG: SMC-Scp complex subunit ScpB, partial [Pseudomonadales bacterium]|nr:SMC-Scp complex subunit ScpB [Pseudomonadales bacterium]
MKLKQIIEGAIMASESPLSLDNLMSLFEMDPPTRDEVRGVLEEIEADCDGRGFELKKLASGYRFQVRSEYGEWVSRLWEERPQRYTRALLETLALIAYKQPITRGDIEEVRGVAVSTNIIRSLLEREWIRIVGHRDVPGRPAMYATTKSFLDYFNLANLDELPTLSEIRDLDEMTSRLDLDEPLIEMKTIVLSDEDVEAEIFEDTDLDEVATTVDTIRENIRRVMAPPVLDDDDDSDDNDADEETVSEDETGVAKDALLIDERSSDASG